MPKQVHFITSVNAGNGKPGAQFFDSQECIDKVRATKPDQFPASALSGSLSVPVSDDDMSAADIAFMQAILGGLGIEGGELDDDDIQNLDDIAA